MAQLAQTESKAFIVVRVRGTTRIRGTIADTMMLLSVHAANNATIVPNNPVNAGMLAKVKDYVTWGEADRDTLVALLRAKASVEENRTLDDAAKESPFKSFDGFVDALLRGEAKMKDVPGLRPTLRMNPPHQGWGTIKRSVKAHGSLGYRGSGINDVIARMLKAAGEPAGSPRRGGASGSSSAGGSEAAPQAAFQAPAHAPTHAPAKRSAETKGGH